MIGTIRRMAAAVCAELLARQLRRIDRQIEQADEDYSLTRLKLHEARQHAVHAQLRNQLHL